MNSPRTPTESTVTVKCVLCGHKETIPLTPEMPMCSKCYGPVTVQRVEARARIGNKR